MALQYHQHIFDLVGIEPEIDTTRLTELETIEHKYNIELPASVKEWFSIVNLPIVLQDYSSFSWQATLKTFGKQDRVTGLLARNNKYVGQRKIIPMLRERNGDWLWLLNLQETNYDPKIVLQVKEFPDMLLSHPHRFVKQAFLNVWDFLVTSRQFKGFYLKSESPPVKPDTFVFLRSYFNEISTTFMLVINETTCRLQKRERFIRIVEDGFSAQWMFYAKNEQALERMLAIILQLKFVKKHILPIPSGKTEAEKSENKQTIKRILARFQ